MGRKIKFACILFIVFMIIPANLSFGQVVNEQDLNELSENVQLWRKLNQTSDKILAFLKEGHYEDAKELLNEFSRQFLTIRAADYNLSMKELQLITSAFEDVQEATTSVSMSDEERIRRGKKLRLLVDVYEHSSDPLWKKTRKSIFAPLYEMEAAIEDGNVQQFRNALNIFVAQYEMVRPAWVVSLPTVTYQQADAQVQYLLNLQQKTVSKKEVLNHLSLMKKHFTNIYDEVEEESSDPQLIWVILTIGGAIVLALTYTAWRKYRAEKQKEREQMQKRRRLY